MRAYLKDYQTALKTFSVGKNDKEGVFPGKPGLGAPNRGQLSRLITRLLDQQMIEPTTESTEKIEPETDWFDDDFGGFDDYGDEDYDEPPEEEMFTALQEAKASVCLAALTPPSLRFF